MNLEKINLTEIAIMIIYEDHVSYIKKQKGFDYHYQYYQEMAKKDPGFQKLCPIPLQQLNNETVTLMNTSIVKQGYCLFLSMSPQVVLPTNIFAVELPSNPTEYQKELLKLYQEEELEFLDISIYNSELAKFETLMKKEDYFRTNSYLLGQYVELMNNQKEEFELE